MKMLILGDISPTGVNAHLFREQNLEALFGNTLPIFENKDFIFANLECALTESDHAIPKFGPNLKAPAETAQVLATLGVSCVGLSNNHIFDFGIEGYQDTVAALHKAGVGYTGFGENYEDSRKTMVIEHGSQKIALITVCEHEYSYALEDRMGSRPFDEFDTPLDVREAKKTCDKVIVIYHGGKEMCQYPSPRLRKLCRTLIKSGADLVVGQHSHCIGTYEEFEGGHILYGQGNTHFVWPDRDPLWNTGVAVVYDTVTGEIEFIPHKNTEVGITLVEGEEKEAIMAAFHDRESACKDGRWKDGWHDFCVKNEENYRRVLANAFAPGSTQREDDNFGHYLDCEAHTDVWRELYPTYNLTNEKE